MQVAFYNLMKMKIQENIQENTEKKIEIQEGYRSVASL